MSGRARNHALIGRSSFTSPTIHVVGLQLANSQKKLHELGRMIVIANAAAAQAEASKIVFLLKETSAAIFMRVKLSNDY